MCRASPPQSHLCPTSRPSLAQSPPASSSPPLGCPAEVAPPRRLHRRRLPVEAAGCRSRRKQRCLIVAIAGGYRRSVSSASSPSPVASPLSRRSSLPAGGAPSWQIHPHSQAVLGALCFSSLPLLPLPHQILVLDLFCLCKGM
jgi:hypothetical protein